MRDIAGELRRYQPRITEKSSADKIRTYVADEILYRSTRVIDVLSEIHPQSDELRDLHKQLESIWMSYHDGFEQFVEDLTDENLPAKRRRLSEILSRCDVRWGTWNAELQRLHEGVRGWSESAPI